jgi:hypothetical protein
MATAAPPTAQGFPVIIGMPPVLDEEVPAVDAGATVPEPKLELALDGDPELEPVDEPLPADEPFDVLDPVAVVEAAVFAPLAIAPAVIVTA